MNPLLLVDYYKTEHHKMYPEGTTTVYSNLTPRKSRMKGVNKVVVFGTQHFIKKYLIDKFNKDFFNRPLEEVIVEYKFAIDVDTSHIEALHKLGYLPIRIKALKEGTLCPIGVPMLTIVNTKPEFYWLTNYLEKLMSCQLWQPITSATIAYEYKKLLTKYALETTGSADFVTWQGHDFSMRGMSSSESAILSGMGHLTSFTGTDTIPAIYALRNSYKASGLIGASVPATEHSVMCMGTKDDEIGKDSRLLDLYPKGILSVVSDTWNLWTVLTDYLPKLKSKIEGRHALSLEQKDFIPAKLVIRPDSGDPVDIICGLNSNPEVLQAFKDGELIGKMSEPEHKGVIELLWETFGGTYVTGADGNKYKLLNGCIGAIYGDSITLDRAQQICERLKAKGFASTNVVLGIGSYTYQYNTRDTFGFAVKATYGEITHQLETLASASGFKLKTDSTIEAREIFKDPITDDGTKKSKKGLLQVIGMMDLANVPKDADLEEFIKSDKFVPDRLIVKDQCTWEEERTGVLEVVFEDGKLVNETSLDEIRERLRSAPVESAVSI